jgi:hypothetical protein
MRQSQLRKHYKRASMSGLIAIAMPLAFAVPAVAFAQNARAVNEDVVSAPLPKSVKGRAD